MGTVIIDSGTGEVKAGIAGTEQPTFVFPSVVGRPRYPVEGGPESYAGSDAESRREVLSIKHPVEFGVVTNFDDVEALWRYTFRNALRVDIEEHAVLLTEPPWNPKLNQEKTAQIMFETFGCPALCLASVAALAVLGAGRTSGVALDIGAGVTHIVPVYEGFSLRYASGHLDQAGRDLTDLLMQLLVKPGVQLTTRADRDLCREIKEKLCYTALDYDGEMLKDTSFLEESYNLPDGRTITVGRERFVCPEALFKPSISGREMPGIHEALNNSITKSDCDLHSLFYANVLLSGGSTSFRGMDDRVEKEMTALAPPGLEVKVIRPVTDKKHLAWVGGSVLASLSTFDQMCLSREDYDEYGPSAAPWNFR